MRIEVRHRLVDRAFEAEKSISLSENIRSDARVLGRYNWRALEHLR